jgi:hypothetical protein
MMMVPDQVPWPVVITIPSGGSEERGVFHFTLKKNDDDPSSTEDKTENKTAVMGPESELMTKSSSFFFSGEAPFPWELASISLGCFPFDQTLSFFFLWMQEHAGERQQASFDRPVPTARPPPSAPAVQPSQESLASSRMYLAPPFAGNTFVYLGFSLGFGGTSGALHHETPRVGGQRY